ncbi:dTDP-Rha--alpha-D-GlcNAc-pyrophosphate polyprenol alpha-3-L-rhamnosyltransferase [Flagellimonas aquimarina]|uniref:dTDP-Rha--alpha-D-GlcNAc-pyrophosphate polyprenol alpha-3-L-rhamnosyltransferase n=1 Tax=Flagellimonas aquimarina TaxID=2201895 RepID=A0A316KYU7_9FLAO|nr:glycosyltransferase family 2 protein [Allomuricauda koreensis]PWL38786.1 dTDP-Rha--alpha-D-GlcNAc-pyrophosphate polyprenol alpha-3-L-rhamnosyltransferase [Allomuricauda koreensis]
MKVAIVILNWNGKALLKRFLPSVIAHSNGASIYVVDNASTDDSVAFVKNTYPAIEVVQNTTNGGFAKGYNDGLKNIEADIFCLLNSDVEVTPNWLEPILNTFNTIPEAAIIQPKILDLKRKEYFEYAGAAGGFIDKLGYPFCRGRIFQALEKDIGQYNDVKEVFWATGACMFIKSDVFRSLKGFDEDYFAHQEEIDLCWRAKNSNYKVYYVGKSQVYHLGGSTLKNMDPKKTFLNFRNSLYSITKNLPRKKALPIIFLRLILDGIAALRFIFQLKFNHCIAILQAHLSFYANFRRFYKKREKANFILKYYSTTSIVWSHFVHQIKNFNILVKD